jgi:hypothetical protein
VGEGVEGTLSCAKLAVEGLTKLNRAAPMISRQIASRMRKRFRGKECMAIFYSKPGQVSKAEAVRRYGKM